MSVTVQELETICEEIANQRKKVDAAEVVKKGENQILADLEKRLLAVFTAEGKTSYQSKVGTLSVSYRASFKTPKEDSDREAFFSYLKEKGVYDRLITVNSQTLNSFCKQEMEAATERGEGLDFSIPGIESPTLNEVLSFRKA